jgi:hypothetical protein
MGGIHLCTVICTVLPSDAAAAVAMLAFILYMIGIGMILRLLAMTAGYVPPKHLVLGRSSHPVLLGLL